MENIKISENSKKNNISLEELSLEISKKFWLESKKISLLIKEIRENSVYSLENLKAELQKENKTLELQKIQELFSDLQKARNIFGKESKKEIINLKQDLKIDTNNYFSNILESKLPRKLIKKAKNPEKPHEHLLWASLWIANSLITIWSWIINVWVWILKSPYDLYLLASWKWELENAKKI